MLLRLVVLVAMGAVATAPSTVRYKVAQKTESIVDLSAFGQGEQTQSMNATYFLSVSYSDSAGGRVVHAVLDSLRVDGGMMPIGQAAIDSAKGTTYHGFLDGDGKLQSLVPSKPSTLGAGFEGTLKLLHPSVKRNARAGDKWSDSLDTGTKTPQADLKSKTIRNFTMSGPATYEGTAGNKFDVGTISNVTGTLETPGGPAEMDGAGTGSGAYYVAADGTFIGSTSSSVTDAKVTISGAPAPIPVKTTTTTTVTVIK